MIAGNIERFKVMPVVFDLRTRGDCKSSIAKNGFDATPCATEAWPRPGSVTSTASLASFCASCADSSALFRASNALCSESLTTLILAPAARRASGSSAPNILSLAVTSPLLPSSRTRIASRSASEVQRVISALAVANSGSKSWSRSLISLLVPDKKANVTYATFAFVCIG
jgi:hypothetical protein